MKQWGKIRKVIGAYMTMMLITSSLLVGCGSASSQSETAKEQVSSMNEVDMSQEVEVTEDATYESGELPDVNTQSTYNRKIIKTGNLYIETKTFNKTIEDLVAYVQKLEGYVESSQIEDRDYSGHGTKYASLTVRVPQKNFDTLLNNGKDFGYVVNMGCETEDVTSQYVDTKLRLEILNTRYERLLNLMKEAKGYDEIFKLEEQVAKVEYEIESYKGTLNQYDTLIDLSTITISVEEVKEVDVYDADEDFLGEMKRTFKRSCRSIKSVMKFIVLAITFILPLLVVIVPIVLLLIWITRKIDRKGKNKTK